MRIDSNGNLGINGNPISYANGQATLFIEDTTNPAIAISDTGQSKDYFIVANGSRLGIVYGDGSNTGSSSNITEIASFNNNGNVGIGTDSPQRQLVLYQNDSGQTQIQFQNQTTGTGSSDGFGVGLDTQEDGFLWNYEGGDIYFGRASTRFMTLEGSSGNVGIGTTNPSAGLTLEGTDGATSTTFMLTSTGVASAGLACDASGLNFGADTGGFVFRTGASANDPTDSGTRRMIIQDNGEVGINILDPLNKLHVHGDTEAAITVSTGASRGGIFLTQPGDNSIIRGSVLVLADTTFRLGTQSHYHIEMQADGKTCINTTGYNVGIGTDSPSARLDVVGDSSNTNPESDLGVYHRFVNSNTGLNTGSAITLGSNNNSGAIIYGQRVGSNNEHKMGFQVRNSSGSATTRMTLSGDGSVSITGATTTNRLNSYDTFRAGNTGRLNLEPHGNLTISFGGDSDSSYYAAIFANNSSSAVGYILVGSSATDYSTSSDYRLKENINYDWDATSRLKQLKPARFNFKTEPDKTIDGLIAHEVSEIVPNAVNGEKDEMKNGEPFYQGIDHSKLVPLLVKTIQELEARIAKLEGE